MGRSLKTLVKLAQISKFPPRLVGKSLTVGYSSDHFLIRKNPRKFYIDPNFVLIPTLDSVF